MHAPPPGGAALSARHVAGISKSRLSSMDARRRCRKKLGGHFLPTALDVRRLYYAWLLSLSLSLSLCPYSAPSGMLRGLGARPSGAMYISRRRPLPRRPGPL